MRAIWVGKRQSSRTACVIRAEVRTGDDKFIANCSIVDISKSGARAKVEVGAQIPAMFALFIPARHETRVCKLRWHRETEIGIEFISAEQITTFEAVISLELRVAALEVAGNMLPDTLLAPGETMAATRPAFDDGPIQAELSALKQCLVQLEDGLAQVHAIAAHAVAKTPEKATVDETKSILDKIELIEADLAKTIELVQVQIGESLKLNMQPRISNLERQNTEILETLRALMPILVNRAS